MELSQEVKKEKQIVIDDRDLDAEVKVKLDDLPSVARTMNELQNMVHKAKISGSKEIEATEDVLRFLQGERYKPEPPYMIYQDVWVYREGMSEAAKAKDALSEEQKTFGHSKVVIDNMGMGHSKA